jgi:hypothetical protein
MRIRRTYEKVNFNLQQAMKKGEWSYSSTVSLTSALEWVGGKGLVPTALAAGENR